MMALIVFGAFVLLFVFGIWTPQNGVPWLFCFLDFGTPPSVGAWTRRVGN